MEKLDNSKIIELLENDDIRRNKLLTNFARIICNNGSNQVISLDGEWGSGKTYFIKKLELLINYLSFYDGSSIRNNNCINKVMNLTEGEINKLGNICNRNNYTDIKDIVHKTNINAIYFNAWEHDDESNPIISLIFAIINELNLYDNTQIKKINSLEKNVKLLISLITKGAINIDNIVQNFDLSESIKLKGKIKEALTSTLNDIINENCNKLVIFVDELDRCKPDYAIEFLEKIHHYFTDNRLVIVLATNIRELANTISTKYGNNFSSEQYLDKFIDERLILPKVDLDTYLRTFNFLNEDYYMDISIKNFIKKYNLQMREINRYLECVKKFKNSTKEIDRFFKYIFLVKTIFVPYVVGLYVITPSKYKQFVNGNNFIGLKEFILNDNIITNFCKENLYKKSEVIDDTKLCEDLQNLYKVFIGKLDNIIIDNSEINNYYVKNIFDNISLLGDLAEFR